jgi:hypothetical protein
MGEKMNKRPAPSTSGRGAGRHLIALSIALAALTPAVAAFHLVGIQEVFVGTPGDSINPNLLPDQRAQYVMLRMTSQGQSVLTGTFIRVEGPTGNILGTFGTFNADVANGGSLGCAYPNCPAFVIGTTAAKNLFTFTFDAIVDGEPGRVALPASGGRACFVVNTGKSLFVMDCVAWGDFICSDVNCPAGPNAFHDGDVTANNCDENYDAPAAPSGLQFGKSLTRTSFNCLNKANSTQFSVLFPRPINNAGTNNNSDTDADGLVNQLDCSDNNSSIQWKPIEVQHVTVNGGASSTDSWDSQSAFVGTGVRYDEIRGSLSALSGFADDSCNNPQTASTSSPDLSLPLAGAGYYYLVRATGGIGCVGTYGTQSNATSRDPQLTTCP